MLKSDALLLPRPFSVARDSNLYMNWTPQQSVGLKKLLMDVSAMSMHVGLKLVWLLTAEQQYCQPPRRDRAVLLLRSCEESIVNSKLDTIDLLKITVPPRPEHTEEFDYTRDGAPFSSSQASSATTTSVKRPAHAPSSAKDGSTSARSESKNSAAAALRAHTPPARAPLQRVSLVAHDPNPSPVPSDHVTTGSSAPPTTTNGPVMTEQSGKSSKESGAPTGSSLAVPQPDTSNTEQENSVSIASTTDAADDDAVGMATAISSSTVSAPANPGANGSTNAEDALDTSLRTNSALSRSEPALAELGKTLGGSSSDPATIASLFPPPLHFKDGKAQPTASAPSSSQTISAAAAAAAGIPNPSSPKPTVSVSQSGTSTDSSTTNQTRPASKSVAASAPLGREEKELLTEIYLAKQIRLEYFNAELAFMTSLDEVISVLQTQHWALQHSTQ